MITATDFAPSGATKFPCAKEAPDYRLARWNGKAAVFAAWMKRRFATRVSAFSRCAFASELWLTPPKTTSKPSQGKLRKTASLERREAERRQAHLGAAPKRDAARVLISCPQIREDRGRIPCRARPHGAGALALRRPTAALRRVSSRLGFRPRFLEPPDANGRTLSGTSAASTSQSGHAPDGTLPKPPAGAVYGRTRENRSRSASRSTLAIRRPSRAG